MFTRPKLIPTQLFLLRVWTRRSSWVKLPAALNSPLVNLLFHWLGTESSDLKVNTTGLQEEERGQLSATVFIKTPQLCWRAASAALLFSVLYTHRLSLSPLWATLEQLQLKINGVFIGLSEAVVTVNRSLSATLLTDNRHHLTPRLKPNMSTLEEAPERQAVNQE